MRGAFRDRETERLADELRQLQAGAPKRSSLLRQAELQQELLARQEQVLRVTRLALEESRSRYESLFEALPIGYVTVGRTGVIVEANPAAGALLQRDAKALVGEQLASLVSEKDLLAIHLERLSKGDVPVRHELHLARPDGALVPIELHSRTDPGEEGEYRMVLHDLSERRREEAARRELEVRARSSHEASEAKDHFLATLGHELRTPLTAVLASVSVLGEEDLPAETRRLLVERIRRNAEAEARLIDDLLDSTRIRRGKLELRRERTDVHRVLQETLDSLGAERLRVRAELLAAESVALVDPLRLGQIAANLLRNALAATAGGGAVWVATSNPRAESLRIEVRDSGVGIPPGEIERLFLPFEQIGPLGGGGGLGLGLAITKELVEAHGGEIGATSAGLGRGSCFTVDLPRGLERSAPNAPARAEARTRRPPSRPMRVLLVEDHADSASSLARLLARRGYEVRVAGSVASALEQAREGLDVLVSDFALPDGDGREVLRRIRERANVPAIAISGFGTARDLADSLRAGFTEHLVKPIDLGRLVQALERLERA